MEGRRIAVRAELVKELLVGRILDAVDQRSPGPAPEAVAEAGGRFGVPAGPAEELARRGYLCRVVERELFEPARAPTPWLAEALKDRTPADLSAELAGEEPADRPSPPEGSWRVPGPGGHVRHFVAIETAVRLPPPRGVDPALLKRCWLYGFYLCCCEENGSCEPSS